MKSPASTSHAHNHLAQCEREYGTAVEALAVAEAALVRANGSYDAALGQEREAALAARRAQSDAEVDCDIARRAVETSLARLETARAAVAAAETERLATKAQTLARELEAVAIRDYPIAARLLRGILRLAAEAEIARDEAIRGGVHADMLPAVEGFRAVPDLPRKVLSTNRVSWPINPRTGDPMHDPEPRRFRSGEAGTSAFVPLGGEREYERATFDRTIVLEAKRGPRFKSFAETLVVPGLMADDVDGWTPPEYFTPHAVLGRLNALENAGPPDRTDRREQRIEMVRVLEAVPEPERA